MVLLILIAAMGGYFAVAQILYLREFLVIFYGNELSIGLILALWLLGITLGAIGGAYCIKRIKHVTPVFFVIVAALALILGFEIYAVRTMFPVPPGNLMPLDRALFAAIITLFPFTVLAGAFFPAACHMVERGNYTDSAGALSIGTVYVAESAGSIAGGILFTFWFVSLPNQFTVIAACGILPALLSAVLLWQSQKWRFLAIMPALLIAAAAVLYETGTLEDINDSSIAVRWRNHTPAAALVENRDTRYQNLTLGEQEDLFSLYSNGHFTLSFPDIYQYAPAAHLFLTQHPRPRDVLLIGGGMGGLLEEILSYPVETVDYVELDPEQIEMIVRHLPEARRRFIDDSRLRIHYVDGRYYVKNTGKKYDLVISNVPDPSTAVINRYYTTGFFTEASRILRDDGVFAAKVSSAVDYLGTDITNYAGSVYQAIRAVFPFVVATPGTENFFFASRKDGTASGDPAVLEERYRAAGIVSPYFSEVQFAQILQPGRFEALNTALRAAQVRSLNTDTKPVTYYYNLILWGKFSGSAETEILRAVARVPFWAVFLAAALLIAARYIYQRRRNVHEDLRFNTIGIITTTGLAGMALEIILIYMFQNIYGYVYQKIGLIVAVFMLGLAGGGLLVNRYIAFINTPNRSGRPLPSRMPEYQRLLLVFEAAILAFSLAVPCIIFLLGWRSAQAAFGPAAETVFYALVLLSGFLTGGEFPLAGKIYFSTGQSLHRTAGLIDGFDCLGASAGALATGLITLPLYGLAQTCILIALLKAGCILLLFTHYRKNTA